MKITITSKRGEGHYILLDNNKSGPLGHYIAFKQLRLYWGKIFKRVLAKL